MPDIEEFQTDDMSLAAYLRMSQPILRTRWRGGTCTWFFKFVDGMDGEITAFRSGTARVNPVEYNQSFAQLKRGAFSHNDGWEDGRVTHFDPQRQFGFVRADDSEPDDDGVYFHLDDFESDKDKETIGLGCKVQFIVKTGPRGSRCKHIKVVEEAPAEARGPYGRRVPPTTA